MPSCQGCPTAILSPLLIAGTPSYLFGLHPQLIQFLPLHWHHPLPCYQHVFITHFTCFTFNFLLTYRHKTRYNRIASMDGPLTHQHLHTHTHTYQQLWWRGVVHLVAVLAASWLRRRIRLERGLHLWRPTTITLSGVEVKGV